MTDQTKTPLLLIDLGRNGARGLTSALEACGLEVTVARDLSQAQSEQRRLNPPLVGLVDLGGDMAEALGTLRDAKVAFPYRQTAVFTDRDDPAFIAECHEEHQVDHLFPLTGDAQLLGTRVAAAARTVDLMQELVSVNHQLSLTSKTDSLTDLYNHGHILEWLRIEHKRAQRDLEPLCCLMIDLDHFKFVNDTYGHSFGDTAMRETAMTLRAALRDSDIIGRYGGEEFLVLAPKTNAVGGRRLAEKLRSTLESHVFKNDLFDVRITASFGVATSDHPTATTPEALLQLADKALYEAKESGRNRVAVTAGEERGLHSAVRGELAATFEPSTSSTPTVLIIDDSPLTIDMLASIVRSMDVNVAEANGEEAALKQIEAHAPDCILLDVHMAGTDGYQICRRIRAMLRETHVPVIFVTSARCLDSQLQGYESGADDYVTKPVVREHLVAKIQAQLRVKALHDRLREANDKLRRAQRTVMHSERHRAVGQLVGGVAHDFNNVLGSMLGQTQRLITQTQSGAILTGLKVVEELIEQGADSIRRLLLYAKVPRESEAIALVNLAQVVEDCVQVTRSRWKDEANRRGVTHTVEIQTDPGITVHASAADLREVVSALIFNALDAMPQGGKLTVSARRHGIDEALVEVCDEGVGVAPGVQRRMFEPFFTTKSDAGTGLGLSIVHGIVSRLHGRVECVTRVNHGSTFRVTLPCEASPEALGDDQAGEVSAAAPAESGSTPRILVIDDERHIREVFTEILSEAGYEASSAADGDSGLRLFREGAFDLVLTDLGMPGMSGWEVARQIRGLRPDAKVVLVSGWGDEVETDAPNRGCVDAALAKPVSLRSLITCVEGLLDRPPASEAAGEVSEIA